MKKKINQAFKKYLKKSYTQVVAIQKQKIDPRLKDMSKLRLDTGKK